MKNGSAIARLVGVFAVCLVLLGYNIYGGFFKAAGKTVTATEETVQIGDKNNAEKKDNAEKKTESVPESTVSAPKNSENTQENSVPTAAAGNAKGKIISNYISPYKAGNSYSNVYLKNISGLEVDLKQFLDAPLKFKIEKSDSPQVLIMHTHTTETYMTEDTDYYTEAFSSRTRDKTKNMVSIGNIVADKLNEAGVKTLHDTTEHDYPKYTGSYTRAAKTINGYLKKYPSIKIVLDLHRDAVSSGESDKVKLVTEINGKKAAQVMLVMGSQSGKTTNFPNWQENFKLAVKLQQTLETKFPTLARPINLTSNNYNESLTQGSLLIEFGTDANTLDEAQYSADMVGQALAELMNKLT